MPDRVSGLLAEPSSVPQAATRPSAPAIATRAAARRAAVDRRDRRVGEGEPSGEAEEVGGRMAMSTTLLGSHRACSASPRTAAGCPVTEVRCGVGRKSSASVRFFGGAASGRFRGRPGGARYGSVVVAVAVRVPGASGRTTAVRSVLRPHGPSYDRTVVRRLQEVTRTESSTRPAASAPSDSRICT